MTSSPIFDLMQRRSAAARELAAALETQPMLAVGVALMDDEEFGHAALRAKRLLTERATHAGLVAPARGE